MKPIVYEKVIYTEPLSDEDVPEATRPVLFGMVSLLSDILEELTGCKVETSIDINDSVRATVSWNNPTKVLAHAEVRDTGDILTFNLTPREELPPMDCPQTEKDDD